MKEQSLSWEGGALAQRGPLLPAPQQAQLPAPLRTLAASSPPGEAASSVQSGTGSTAVFIALSESVLHKLGEKPTFSQKQPPGTQGCTGSLHCGRCCQHTPGPTGPGEEVVGPSPPYRRDKEPFLGLFLLFSAANTSLASFHLYLPPSDPSSSLLHLPPPFSSCSVRSKQAAPHLARCTEQGKRSPRCRGHCCTGGKDKTCCPT